MAEKVGPAGHNCELRKEQYEHMKPSQILLINILATGALYVAGFVALGGSYPTIDSSRSLNGSRITVQMHTFMPGQRLSFHLDSPFLVDKSRLFFPSRIGTSF